jgi:sporulation protein YlmC with PRC-barrel domain
MATVSQRTGDPLIATDRVTGTAVYNRAGEKLGTVDNIMLDKVSGKAVYAVMSFGGFLGIGENQYPLPWSQLNYDVGLGGYVVDLDKRVLEGAPSYERGDTFEWTPEYGRTVDKYYKVPSYWD